MHLSKYFYVAASLLAVSVSAMPDAEVDAVARSAPDSLPGLFNLEKRKACSGNREDTDVCGGKKYKKKRNSFHNCQDTDGGKCCAKNADGTGGIDTKGNLGREDCGYCFSKKCSA